MKLPELLKLKTEEEYRQYYIENYCTKSPILTYDGFPVLFFADRFGHSFYKRAQASWSAPKSCLDVLRCERLPWIKAVLQDPSIIPHVGYDKAKNRYDPTRRVSFLTNENYLVVILIDNQGKWRFNTAYVVDNEAAANKIKRSPIWTK